MKSFSPMGTLLTMSSKCSYNSLSVLSLWPTCGAYTLITLRTKSPSTSLNPVSLPLDVYHSILEALVDQNAYSILFVVVPVYHSLKPESSNSFALCACHLVSWTHRISTPLLTHVYPTFQLPKRILLGSAIFLNLRIF